MFLNQVRGVDVSEIADEVFSDLDFLDVKNSGIEVDHIGMDVST